jgi:predicted ATPase/DNA-binding SARP family transcriptional activator/DNA-binding CsgD family transcriptional regulator
MTHQPPGTHGRRGIGSVWDDTAGVVRVWLLGGFKVSVGSRAVADDSWRLRKAQSLIKLLALAPGHRMHRDRIMDVLWPGLDAASSSNNLHRTLHFTRKVLETAPSDAASPCLSLLGDMVALCPDGPLWVDVESFESAASGARRSREPAAYRAAVELYAGELLPEDLYEAWTEGKREQLRLLYHSLLIELAALHEQREEHGPAIEALERVVAEEPTSEEAHVALMRLYAFSGRRREAMLQYGRLREAFLQKLDEEPGDSSRRLYEEISSGEFPAAPSPTAGRPAVARSGSPDDNLPASLTSFVGREREILEVKRSLSMTRLLTLTGAGGSGKTRLALEVARDLVGAYRDGVWLVELAPLRDPALLPRAVVAELDVREQPGRPLEDSLSDHLRTKDMLLVLDNCEHLVEAVARLAETLLKACPMLRILATSREAIRVPGETVWPVPTLSLPQIDGALTVEGLARYEAVRLFVDRARSRLPTFELNRENARSVAAICRELDGIPLAIELACARMGALAVEQVAERLEDSLGLLTGGDRTVAPRQQTLRATLDWSHGLLSEAERALFRRLPVFAGGWTLEAAEEVYPEGGAGRDDVLDLLSRLLDKSLVVAEAGGDGALRYRMLEPVRQYAWERLEESAEGEQVRERHARYYLALAERAEPELAGAAQITWLERLATEYANLRAALSWFLDEEGAEERARMGLRLAVALGRFWSVHTPSEGREWLEEGLARSGTAPASLRAKALREVGLIAIYHLDPQAIAMLEEALLLFKELEDEFGQAVSINYLMHAVGILGYHERIPTLREQTAALLEGPLEDERAVAYLQLTLGMMAMIEQDHAQVTRIEEALALFRKVGDLRTSAMCLTIMGIAALGRGDAGRAAPAFEETLRLLDRLKDKIGTFYSLMGAAGVAALQGRPARAARLSGAAEALRKAIGHPAQPLKRVNYDYEAYLASTRGALGEAAFEAAFSEGQAMSPKEAIEYALSEDEPAPPAVPAPREARTDHPARPLTPREREVALLVARGLTNRQIASELTISENTVANHVAGIIKKLDLPSRSLVAVWVTERGLREME